MHDQVKQSLHDLVKQVETEYVLGDWSGASINFKRRNDKLQQGLELWRRGLLGALSALLFQSLLDAFKLGYLWTAYEIQQSTGNLSLRAYSDNDIFNRINKPFVDATPFERLNDRTIELTIALRKTLVASQVGEETFPQLSKHILTAKQQDGFLLPVTNDLWHSINVGILDAAEQNDVTLYWEIWDEDACKVCKSLQGQQIKPGEYFESSLSGMYYQSPPAHPHCRCYLIVFNRKGRMMSFDKWLSQYGNIYGYNSI